MWLRVPRQSVSVWFAEYEKEHPNRLPTAEQALALVEFLRRKAKNPNPD